MIVTCCEIALVLVGIALVFAVGGFVLTVYGLRLTRAAVEDLIGEDRAHPPRRGGVH